MGKGRYNAKARQVVKTDIDNSKTSEVTNFHLFILFYRRNMCLLL